MKRSQLVIGLAQFAPIVCNKFLCIERICDAIEQAANDHVDLLIFGEAFVPGYPFCLSLSNAAAFNNEAQKDMFAYYAQQAVQIEKGDLAPVLALAKRHKIAVYLGIVERPIDRGNHSLYCSLVYINGSGEICSVHRKLQPTYEERLCWSPGDGNGLKVHELGAFRVGGLNCWENWMPLSRAALYGQGENLHVAVWPGSERNTQDITRFIAKESRSFVASVSGLMRKTDFDEGFPHLSSFIDDCPAVIANGGSCLAAPNGEWIIPPVLNKSGVFIAEINVREVLKERQNFDPSGHYSRPDVMHLKVNRKRQRLIDFEGD